MDDEIREHHGCECREGKAISIWESADFVHLDGSAYTRAMTPKQARYLASKLYRLSRRIRARVEPEIESDPS